MSGDRYCGNAVVVKARDHCKRSERPSIHASIRELAERRLNRRAWLREQRLLLVGNFSDLLWSHIPWQI